MTNINHLQGKTHLLKKGIFIASLFSLILGSELIPLEREAVAQPSPIQTKVLLATNLKIVVPNYIPQGFVLWDIQVSAERNPKSDRFSYILFYRNTNGENCFGIQGNNNAYLGKSIEAADTKTFNVNSSVFGKTVLQIIKVGGDSQFMRSHWLTKTPPCKFNDDRCMGMGYRFIGMTRALESEGYPQLKRCQDISVSEAIKITESFQYLNP